jgi:hypothetical protein
MNSLHDARLTKTARGVLQAVAYAAFLLPIAWLTAWPAYRQLPEDAAAVKLSVRHSGKVVGACRELSAEELAQLPPNMRAPQVCPRERSPLRLQLSVNDRQAVDVLLPAKGLHSDGMASFYRRITVPAGQLTLNVRMNDDASVAAFAYEEEFTSVVEPGRVLAIDFDARSGRFVVL